MSDVTKPCRAEWLLFPLFLERVNKGLKKCREAGVNVYIFESYRSPARQDYLYAQGRTRPGKIVTKAKGGQSWHALGVAVDIVAKDAAGKWTWEYPVEKVRDIMTAEGLESLYPFENAHYQLTGGLRVDAAHSLAVSGGLLRLWQEIAASIGVKE